RLVRRTRVWEPHTWERCRGIIWSLINRAKSCLSNDPGRGRRVLTHCGGRVCKGTNEGLVIPPLDVCGIALQFNRILLLGEPVDLYSFCGLRFLVAIIGSKLGHEVLVSHYPCFLARVGEGCRC